MKVWISYSSHDEKFVKLLAEDLISYNIEVDTKENIKPGESIIRKITSGIKLADIILVIVASHSSTDNWQISEIATALSEEKFIIPILIEKNIYPPVFLEHLQYIDFTEKNNYDLNIKLLKDSLCSRDVKLNNSKSFEYDFIDAQKKISDLIIQNEKIAYSKFRHSIFEKLAYLMTIFTIILGILSIGIIGNFPIKITPFLMGLIIGLIGALIGYLLSKYLFNRFRLKEADK